MYKVERGEFIQKDMSYIERLYDKYFRVVYHFAFSYTNSREEAEDRTLDILKTLK